MHLRNQINVRQIKLLIICLYSEGSQRTDLWLSNTSDAKKKPTCHSVIFYHDIKVFITFYSFSASKESVQAENWYRFHRQLCGKRKDCRNHQITASQGNSLQKHVCSHDINICIPILQDIKSENSRWSKIFSLPLYVFLLRKPLKFMVISLAVT